MCLGLDATIEGEEGDAGNEYASGDKLGLNLPGLQEELLETVTAVGKPVILLLTAGSAIDLSWAEKCKSNSGLLVSGSKRRKSGCRGSFRGILAEWKASCDILSENREFAGIYRLPDESQNVPLYG